MAENQSKNVYLDNNGRRLLGWFGVSVLPLWRAWELIIDWLPDETPIPYLGPGVQFFLDRLEALAALTKAALATLLDETWGEQLDPNNFLKNELIMKVLAYENMWVDLAYGEEEQVG